MLRVATQVLEPPSRAVEWAKQVGVVIGASLVVALCARLTVPLPFTPVPLTMQNFGVLLVALLLGSRRGFAALALYLIEGACGLPVFNASGPGGIAQILGPTGGFLMAYPLVAFATGSIYVLVGLGLVLIFSVTRVVFVPFGDIVAFSALTLASMQLGRMPGTAFAQHEEPSSPRAQLPLTILQINDVYSTVPIDGLGGLAKVARLNTSEMVPAL